MRWFVVLLFVVGAVAGCRQSDYNQGRKQGAKDAHDSYVNYLVDHGAEAARLLPIYSPQPAKYPPGKSAEFKAGYRKGWIAIMKVAARPLMDDPYLKSKVPRELLTPEDD